MTASGLVLQHVAERAGLQRREEVIVVVVDRDHDGLRLRLRLAQGGHDVDAGAVGQAEVDQGDVDLLLGDDGERGVDARCVEEHGSGKTSATCTLSQALASATSSNSKMFVMRTSDWRRPGVLVGGGDRRDMAIASGVPQGSRRRSRRLHRMVASAGEWPPRAHSGTVSEITTP